MPCFVCTKCGCIDNTATGHYWCCESIKFEAGSLPEELVGKPLCKECMPPKFSDGSPTGGGVWHGIFPKQHWSVKFEEKPQGLI